MDEFDDFDDFNDHQAEPPPRPSLANRFAMVLMQPEKLARALGANPAWFPVALLVALGTAGIIAVLPAELWEAQIEASGQPGTDAAVMITRIVAPLGTFIVMLLTPIVISAVTALVFIFMRGDDATYRQHLSVVSHAMIIILIGTALSAPLQARAGTLEAGLTLGTFFPFLPEGFLLTFLSQISLFGLWAIVVTGIGLAALDPRRRAGPTTAVLMALQLILALSCASMAAAFSPDF